jgi:hypothetical protein
MANPSIQVYPKAQQRIGEQSIDFENDTLKVILLQNSYTYSDAHEFIDDLTPATHEHDGAGYSRASLAGAAITLRADALGAKYDANDVTFAALAAGTLALRYAAVAKFVTDDADSPLVFLLDFGQDQDPDGSDFQIVWPTGGIWQTRNAPGPNAVTSVDADSASGQKVLNVASTVGMLEGASVAIDPYDVGGRFEVGTIDTISAGVSITLLANLTYTHTAAQGDVVYVRNN